MSGHDKWGHRLSPTCTSSHHVTLHCASTKDRLLDNGPLRIWVIVLLEPRAGLDAILGSFNIKRNKPASGVVGRCMSRARELYTTRNKMVGVQGFPGFPAQQSA